LPNARGVYQNLYVGGGEELLQQFVPRSGDVFARDQKISSSELKEIIDMIEKGEEGKE